MTESPKLFNPLPAGVYLERLNPRDEDIRGPYFRDQTAIIHSMPFRRMKHKAQVFFSPNNDHVCTRIEHSLHVATIAETISRGLGLNGELACAIGLGHDLGHAPFGHAGERVLSEKARDAGGFEHESYGLRVVDVLGNHGTTLNLTYGVRDGIVCHCGESPDMELEPRRERLELAEITGRSVLPCSLEGCVARMSDRIAYLGRDLEDAIYGGFISHGDIPDSVDRELGTSNGEIIDTLVIDVIETSQHTGRISMSPGRYGVLMELYTFSAERIHHHPAMERYKLHCERIIRTLFDYLMELMAANLWEIPAYLASAT
ncbi:MAG: HD domain-containing protein, partial [Myxococcota bacterium]